MLFILYEGIYSLLEISHFHTTFKLSKNKAFNSTPHNRPIENWMGLIARYIEIARGKVK